MTTTTPIRFTAHDWDEVRAAFATSIMVDTALTSLAQNLEGPDWPLAGSDQTPAKYIDLSFAEMRELLAMQGQPPKTADFLISVLKETLAFDDPFGEMVTQSEISAVRDNPLLKNLTRLGIPSDFPVALTALSPETLTFCRLENITTLGGFAMTAQTMAQSVIVGGDFRGLLNALSHVDEKGIARYLPFRPGEKGLHFIEGVAHAVRAQPSPVRAGLAKRLAYALSEAERELASSVTPQQLTYARTTLAQRANSLRAYFVDEAVELEELIAAGGEAPRLVAMIGDPLLEVIVVEVLKQGNAPRGADKPELKAGTTFLGRLLGWMRK
jgi:hypothetical protein